MGEMIERVAKAMENRAEVAGVSIHAAALSDEDWLELARGAMEAIREPTEAMMIGARDWSALYVGSPIGNKAATGCFQSMIDAELR